MMVSMFNLNTSFHIVFQLEAYKKKIVYSDIQSAVHMPMAIWGMLTSLVHVQSICWLLDKFATHFICYD